MIGSITAELLILRKRTSTWILLTIWIILATVFSYIVPYVTYRNNEGGPSAEPLDDLLPSQFANTVLSGFPFYGGAIVLILGVLTLGSDYGWGTLKTLFTQRPGRFQVFAAKLAAAGVILIPFVLAIYAIGAIGSYAIALAEDASTDWPSAWLLVRSLAASWFLLAVWTTFGVVLAVVSRGTALAIGVGVLYAMAIEGLITALAEQVSFLEPIVDFFIRANGYSLIRPLGSMPDNDGPGFFEGNFVDGLQAFIVLALYLATFVAISASLLRRRDVV